MLCADIRISILAKKRRYRHQCHSRLFLLVNQTGDCKGLEL